MIRKNQALVGQVNVCLRLVCYPLRGSRTSCPKYKCPPSSLLQLQLLPFYFNLSTQLFESFAHRIDSCMSSCLGDHHAPALARTLCLVVHELTGVSDGAYHTEAYGGLVEGLLRLSMTVGIQLQENLALPVGRDL